MFIVIANYQRGRQPVLCSDNRVVAQNLVDFTTLFVKSLKKVIFLVFLLFTLLPKRFIPTMIRRGSLRKRFKAISRLRWTSTSTLTQCGKLWKQRAFE